MFSRIAIYGVGLIGGSIGLAVQAKWPKTEVVGVGRSETSLKRALAKKAVHTYTRNIGRGFSNVDLAVLCAPVGPVLDILKTELASFPTPLLVTDACSTKELVVKTAGQHLPPHISFVGSHPVAGSEKSGCRAADGRLFRGRVTVLTPAAQTSTPALEKIERFWKGLGSKTVILTPENHDEILALTSHLPHLLAVAVSNLSGRLSPEEARDFIGTGFRDFTRIARGNPEIWEDVFLTNSKNLAENLSRLEESVAEWKAALRDNNRLRIRELLEAARAFQEGLPGRRQGEKE